MSRQARGEVMDQVQVVHCVPWCVLGVSPDPDRLPAGSHRRSATDVVEILSTWGLHPRLAVAVAPRLNTMSGEIKGSGRPV